MPARDDEIAAAWLAGVPGATAHRLRALWARFGTPSAAADAVESGAASLAGAPDPDPDPDIDPDDGTGGGGTAPLHARPWLAVRTRAQVAGLVHRRGTRVVLPDDPDWPFGALPPDAPAALALVEGCGFEALTRPAVAIVGTRAATPHGLADAREIAGAAARAGYVVVSGLALGIDTAAHEGALDAGGLTIGVVATGVDVVYPRRNAGLYDRVRAQGLVVSEHGFGVPPERWRFPVRNRLIAALGAVTVVVEAKARGGALSTARHAMALGRDVLAIPGSRRNGAAKGTNALIRDGAHVLTDAADLFVALGRADSVHASRDRRIPTVPLSGAARTVLDACGGDAASLDALVSRSGLSTAEVAGAIRELQRVGRIERARGLLWPL